MEFEKEKELIKLFEKNCTKKDYKKKLENLINASIDNGENLEVLLRYLALIHLPDGIHKEVCNGKLAYEYDDIEYILNNADEQRKTLEDCLTESITTNDKRITPFVYLTEYLCCIDMGEADKFKIVTEGTSENDPTQIEHIFPQSKAKTLGENQKCINKIGNKILLEKYINGHCTNFIFTEKKTGKISSRKQLKGYKDSEYRIARILAGSTKQEWNLGCINKLTNIFTKRIINFILSENVGAQKCKLQDEIRKNFC